MNIRHAFKSKRWFYFMRIEPIIFKFFIHLFWFWRFLANQIGIQLTILLKLAKSSYNVMTFCEINWKRSYDVDYWNENRSFDAWNHATNRDLIAHGNDSFVRHAMSFGRHVRLSLRFQWAAIDFTRIATQAQSERQRTNERERDIERGRGEEWETSTKTNWTNMKAHRLDDDDIQ